MLDFRMETFLAVCRYMNFTRAAEKLNITQPAVSQHIRFLEKHYNTKLFRYEGKKLELIKAHPQASFCMDTGHELVKGEAPCSWSFRYESVMGQGELTQVQDPEEKRHGLQTVMEHYSGSEAPVEFPDEMMHRVVILKLNAKNLTGKQHK